MGLTLVVNCPAVLYVKLKVSVSNMVVLQDLLVRVSPMLLGWHLLRSTWLPASTSLTMRLSTTTRNNSNVNVPVLLLVCTVQFW